MSNKNNANSELEAYYTEELKKYNIDLEYLGDGHGYHLLGPDQFATIYASDLSDVRLVLASFERAFAFKNPPPNKRSEIIQYTQTLHSSELRRVGSFGSLGFDAVYTLPMYYLDYKFFRLDEFKFYKAGFPPDSIQLVRNSFTLCTFFTNYNLKNGATALDRDISAFKLCHGNDYLFCLSYSSYKNKSKINIDELTFSLTITYFTGEPTCKP